MSNNINSVEISIEDDARAIIDKANTVVKQIGGPQNLMQCFYPNLNGCFPYNKILADDVFNRGYNPISGRLLAIDKTFTLISMGEKRQSQQIIDVGLGLISEYDSTCVSVVSDALKRGVISREILDSSAEVFLEAWKGHDGSIENQINSTFEDKLSTTLDMLEESMSSVAQVQ